MRVLVECANTNMAVTLLLTGGRKVQDSDSVGVAVVNYLALGGDQVLTSVMPEGGFDLQADDPLARDLIVAWLRSKGESISASEFVDTDHPKWTLPEPLHRECGLDHS